MLIDKGDGFMGNVIIKNIRTETKLWDQSTKSVEELTANHHLLISEGKVLAYLTDKDLVNYPQVKEVDGMGLLLLPSLREMHCHLDKVKLGTPWTPISYAEDRIQRFSQEIDELNALDLSVIERAKQLIDLEISYGVTHFRSHVDVHSVVGLDYLNGVLEATAEYKDKASFEIIAFPQHGLLRSQSIEVVDLALANGANLIGGIDPATVDGDYRKSLEATFDLATKHGAPIDLHIHDRGKDFVETLNYLLELTEKYGWQGKVAISHAFGLNDLGPDEDDLFRSLADNQIQIISSVPVEGSTPPLEKLRQFGVSVFLGCDNIYDCWSPFGDGNVREKLSRYGEMFDFKLHKELTYALPLITGKAIDEGYINNISGLKVGDEASFILTAASCIAEFVARPIAVEQVFFKGKRIK